VNPAPPIAPYSWDQGLFATNTADNLGVHAWGLRRTNGAWGTGPVNYQSGGTYISRASAKGTMTFSMGGTYCPNNVCSYGSGTGYKGLVQLWNDPNNFIAFGLIHDPGVSPNGTTIMIEGAANGKPVGGYWAAGAISGTSHNVSVSWSPSGVTFQLDSLAALGPYPLTITGPSISLLGAGRQTGDVVDVTFSGLLELNG
jgi:hypothetical protein